MELQLHRAVGVMEVAKAQGRGVLGLKGPGQPVGGRGGNLSRCGAIPAGAWGLVTQIGRPIRHNQIKIQQAAPGVPVDAVQQQVPHGAADEG